jgi:hypothetical protein
MRPLSLGLIQEERVIKGEIVVLPNISLEDLKIGGGLKVCQVIIQRFRKLSDQYRILSGTLFELRLLDYYSNFASKDFQKFNCYSTQ